MMSEEGKALFHYLLSHVLSLCNLCGPLVGSSFLRPILGRVNFCPSRFSIPTTEEEYTSLFALAVHEMSHALGELLAPGILWRSSSLVHSLFIGFISVMFPYMRYKDGSPRTPRGPDGFPLSNYTVYVHFALLDRRTLTSMV